MAKDNLERQFELFIEEKQLLPFFKGLSGYVDYAQATSPHKEVFQQHMAEYEEGHKKISELESNTIAEMVEIKDELVAIIKKRGLNVKEFKRLQTFSFNDDTDMLEEFDGYLHGRAVGSGFRSDSLQNYLFDIAANLLALGYKDDIKKYLVTDEEYAAYYARVNGTKAWAIRGENVNGNFIFAPTWPERWQAASKFERERSLKPWGSFVKLSQFKRAYDAVARNEDIWVLLREDKTAHNRLKVHDTIDVVNMARDLGSFVDESSRLGGFRLTRSSESEMQHLKKDELKTHVQAVHNLLLRGSSSPSAALTDFDAEKSELRVKKDVFPIRRVSDQYDVLRIIFEDRKEAGREWFFDDIAEKIDAARPHERVKKYYNAAYQLNRKLASQGVKDFFILNSHSLKITPHYLS